MGKIVTWLLKKIGFDFAINAIYIGVMIIYGTAILAIYASLVVAFFYLYDLIQSFIALIGNSGSIASSPVLDYMYTMMNCLGLTDALNDSKSILIGGVVFIMARLAGEISVKAYRNLMDAVAPLLKS